jgi:hypothetical protein
LGLSVLLSACAAPAPPAPLRAITAYRLAERVVDGMRLTVLEPVTDEPAGFAVSAEIEAEMTPLRAAPGEVVRVRIRVKDADPRARYEITIEPSRPGVEIVGSARFAVVGWATVEARFVARSQGEGGIVIRATRR